MFNYKDIAPAIRIYENVLSNPQRLIDIGNGMPEAWTQSSLATDSDGGSINKEYRNSRAMEIVVHLNNPIEWFESSKMIWECAKHYAVDFEFNFSEMEPLQMLHYENKTGFYKPHYDTSEYYPRVFSAVLYLNDIAVGGETYFNLFDIGVKPKAGDLVMFPANYAYIHQASIPESEDKYILVTWFKPVVITQNHIQQ